jgi:hypothetical protein
MVSLYVVDFKCAPNFGEVQLAFGEFGYLKDFFLLFPFWMFLIYMRGVLAEFSPGSLVDPVQPVPHQAS